MAGRQIQPDAEPILAMRDIRFHYGAVEALRGAGMEAYRGGVTALMGDNGAGKSTLIKCMSGILRPSGGEYRFEGRTVSFRGPRDASARGIETVYQDLALCDNLDVVANLFLGRESRAFPLPALGGVLDEDAMESKAKAVLERLSVNIPDPRVKVAALSGGQRQSVAVARAVLWNSKLVILDEPTAALGVAQTRQVLDLILRLKEEGLAVILISHNLADVFSVADRIVVLRLGRTVARFEVRDTSPEDVVAAITGASVPGDC